ncbi:MAG: hypothetical protein U5P10_10610 [Spirochaetia bacterium]|nr:hypothetical protein [Spirochaetia bacterium]
MKRIAFITVLSLLLPLTILVALPFPSSYHTLEDMHTFYKNYPRFENSQNEKQTFNYIINELDKKNIDFRRIDLGGFENFHSFSSIVEANFQGTTDNDLYFIFPVNHPMDAAQVKSGAAGLTLALQLCRSLSEMNLTQNVHVLFLGAEYGRSDEYKLGTRAFLEEYHSETPSQVLYFTIPTSDFKIELRAAGSGIVSPAWFVEYTSNSLLRNQVAFQFSTIRFNLYQMGLNETTTRIDPYLDSNLPSLHLFGEPISEDSAAAEEHTNIDELHSFLINYVKSYPEEIPDQWDRHYILYKLGTYTQLIPEFSYIIIILALFAAVLLYPFFRRKRFYRYLGSMRRNGWVLPIILALMFFYLLLATIVLEGIALYRQYNLLWQQQPFLLLLLKISIAGFLFALSHRVTTPFHFTRLRGSFYSAAGLFFLLVNVLILTTYNLSLTLYGAAIFILGFLFTVVRRRLTKLIYLILSIVFIIGILLTIFQTGTSRAVYLILLSRVQGNLLIAFHMLPYMLFILRLRVLYHHPAQSYTRRITLAFDLLFGTLSIALLVYLLFFYSLSPGSRRPLQVYEQIDAIRNHHTLNFESSEPLGFFTYGSSPLATAKENGQAVEVESDNRETRKELPFQDPLLDVTIDSRDFLGRTTYQLGITAPFPIEDLQVTLSSEASITLYDSDFPVSPLRDPNTLQFHIGRFPSNPFSFTFTVPEELKGVLKIAAEVYSLPYTTQLDRSRFDIEYHLKAIQSIPLN